jgi:hypothetical protein
MFDGLRDRVRKFRNAQDDLAIKKAEATIEYAVSPPPARLSISI